jgi:LuxR family maltose regulon positive regulatory protein
MLDALERRRQEAEGKARIGSVVEILIVQALAMQARGDSDAAMTALGQALALAEPEGYIRIFVDKGELKPLLAKFRNSSHELEPYASKLLSAFRGAPASEGVTHSRSSSDTLIEPLSERELQVLHLIAAGASNQEIADNLVISIATVKRHITNLYGKLDVTSRTQAVARARELQML